MSIMSNPFETLAGFLDRFSGEVEGRSLEEPSAELRLKLQQFARGTLAESERDSLILLLKENPHWVSLIAGEVKALRGSPGRQR